MVAVVAALVLVSGVRTRSQDLPSYDPGSETAITGNVQATEDVLVAGTGWRSLVGTQVVLKSGDNTVRVYIGPTEFVRMVGLDLAVDDPVEVHGTRVQADGDEVVLARDIKRRNTTWTLRDPKGDPLWTRLSPTAGTK